MTSHFYWMVIVVLAAIVIPADGTCGDDVTDCARLIKSNGTLDEICSSIRSSYECVRRKVNADSDCTEQDKRDVAKALDSANALLRQYGCSGSAGLMASLLLSLGLSIVTYFLTSLK